MNKLLYTKEDINTNLERIIKQTWKIIPMREEDQEWEKQLQTVINEIRGLGVILDFNNLILMSKLEGLNNGTTSKEFCRKTIFECLELIKEAKVVE